MRRLIVLLAMAVLGALGSAAANAEVSTNTSVPIDVITLVPCTGNAVELSGPLHVLITETVNGNSVSGHEHFQPQRVTGVALTTGSVYQATGETSADFRVSVVMVRLSNRSSTTSGSSAEHRRQTILFRWSRI
jgi:hypothetical protein